jgi:hypothetical protein
VAAFAAGAATALPVGCRHGWRWFEHGQISSTHRRSDLTAWGERRDCTTGRNKITPRGAGPGCGGKSFVTRSIVFVTRSMRFVTRSLRFVTHFRAFVTRFVRFVTRFVRFVTRFVRFVTRFVHFVTRLMSFMTRLMSFVTRSIISVAGSSPLVPLCPRP